VSFCFLGAFGVVFFLFGGWLGGGGGLLKFLFLRGFWCVFLFFIIMVPSLQPPSMQNTPCLYCFGLYTLGGFFRHVKSAHPRTNLVSQAR
jgi:hypothetical protein